MRSEEKLKEKNRTDVAEGKDKLRKGTQRKRNWKEVVINADKN
jgi:hypothetical protein